MVEYGYYRLEIHDGGYETCFIEESLDIKGNLIDHFKIHIENNVIKKWAIKPCKCGYGRIPSYRDLKEHLNEFHRYHCSKCSSQKVGMTATGGTTLIKCRVCGWGELRVSLEGSETSMKKSQQEINEYIRALNRR